MINKSIWWEKTVEYKFVLDAARDRGLDFAVPLAGIQESAGDGIFSADAKIILVEFKRSSHELVTESDKFISYETAANELSSQDGHHFLIYGECPAKGGLTLQLRACTYFSRVYVQNSVDVLSKGLEPTAFKEYLVKLLAQKKVDGRSSGTVDPESVASAFGVSPRGAEAVSLSEYCRIAMPNLFPKQSDVHIDKPSAPSFGF